MKFCPVVPKICRGQVHGPRKEEEGEEEEEVLCPLSALSLDEGLNTLNGKTPVSCCLIQTTNQMSDISVYAH
jgi:hypothetical protein